MSGPPRLRSQGDALGRRLQAASEWAEATTTAQRERIWRGLREPRRARGRLIFALGAAAMLALLLFAARRSRGLPVEAAQGLALQDGAGARPLSAGQLLPADAQAAVAPGGFALLGAAGAGDVLRAALGPSSRAHLESTGLHLDAGAGAFSVRGAKPVRIGFGAAYVEASSARFVLEAHGERLKLRALDGEVRVEAGGKSERVQAGSSWSSDGAPAAEGAVSAALIDLLQSAPGEARARAGQKLAQAETGQREQELLAQAGERERSGDARGAAGLLAELAAGDGPRAGVALYDLARLRLERLGEPAQALAALADYQRRFPGGPLGQEAALASIEARLALGQEEEAQGAMQGFLEKYPQSERAGEVHWLRGSLLLRSGSCGGALADLRAASNDPRRGDEASFALATCAAPAQARAALRDYLSRFPNGRHVEAARDALGQHR